MICSSSGGADIAIVSDLRAPSAETCSIEGLGFLNSISSRQHESCYDFAHFLNYNFQLQVRIADLHFAEGGPASEIKMDNCLEPRR